MVSLAAARPVSVIAAFTGRTGPDVSVLPVNAAQTVDGAGKQGKLFTAQAAQVARHHPARLATMNAGEFVGLFQFGHRFPEIHTYVPSDRMFRGAIPVPDLQGTAVDHCSVPLPLYFSAYTTLDTSRST